jgi:hypothetical protein
MHQPSPRQVGLTRWETRTFAQIFSRLKHLEVPRNVKAAEATALQRMNVIHMVFYTSLRSQGSRHIVHFLDLGLLNC